MQPIKLVIEIKGGNVSAVVSNAELRYILIDRDNTDRGMPPVADPMEPNALSSQLYTLYDTAMPQEKEIREALKHHHF